MMNVPIDHSMNLTPAFSRTPSQRKTVLKVVTPSKVVQMGSSSTDEGPKRDSRDTSTPFGPVPVETVEQPVESLISVDINSRVPYFISNGRPVLIYGTRL